MFEGSAFSRWLLPELNELYNSGMCSYEEFNAFIGPSMILAFLVWERNLRLKRIWRLLMFNLV